MMKIADIRNFGQEDLVSKKREARQELFNLGLQKQTGQIEKPSRVRELKKTVARIETVMTEQRKGIKVGKKA